MVLILCTLSADALYLYQVSCKYLKKCQLYSGHEMMTHGQNDEQTDEQTEKVITLGPPQTSSCGP